MQAHLKTLSSQLYQADLVKKNGCLNTLPQYVLNCTLCATPAYCVLHLHTVCYTWGLDPLKSKLVSLRPWVWPQLQRASDNNAQHNLPMEMSPLIFMLPRVRSPISQHDASYGNGGMGIFMPSTLATYTFHLHIAPPLGPAKNFPSRIALRQRHWRKCKKPLRCADCEHCVVEISLLLKVLQDLSKAVRISG